MCLAAVYLAALASLSLAQQAEPLVSTADVSTGFVSRLPPPPLPSLVYPPSVVEPATQIGAPCDIF